MLTTSPVSVAPDVAPTGRSGAEPPPDHVDARPTLARVSIGALVALTLLVHLLANRFSPYGVHRDELLYLAMGRHLRFWRMDFPPAIAVLAVAERTLSGDSLVSIRLVPALAAAALVLLAALVARALGGGRGAQTLAGLAVLCNPLFLRTGSLFQPVVLDQLTWTVALYALIRLARDEDPRWWVAFGVAAGIGLLVKFSILFFGFAALLALLLSPGRVAGRRALLGRWPWIAAALALLIGAPTIVGQIRLGFPVVGQMADLRASQLGRVTSAEFLSTQLLFGPATLLALVGLVALLAAPALRRYRVVGLTCALAFALLLVLRGKGYYIGPNYPTLYGAGAAALARSWSSAQAGSGSTRNARLTGWGLGTLIVAYGVITLPLGVPILPPARMAAYAQRLGITAAVRTNRGEVDRLPQDYADMLGWEAQVAAVADVWRVLPAEDRARAVIVAENYGEAGALDFYGPRYGLPDVVSTAGSFWFFGPGEKPGEIVISLGVPERSLVRFFGSVEPAARVGDPWSVSEERDVPIFVSHDPRTTLQQLWPSLAGRN